LKLFKNKRLCCQRRIWQGWLKGKKAAPPAQQEKEGNKNAVKSTDIKTERK